MFTELRGRGLKLHGEVVQLPLFSCKAAAYLQRSQFRFFHTRLSELRQQTHGNPAPEPPGFLVYSTAKCTPKSYGDIMVREPAIVERRPCNLNRDFLIGIGGVVSVGPIVPYRWSRSLSQDLVIAVIVPDASQAHICKSGRLELM